MFVTAYQPTPLERAYTRYILETIFHSPTPLRISGRVAVPFLSSSGVDRRLLREIWNFVDPSMVGSLTEELQLQAALKLVALAQQQARMGMLMDLNQAEYMLVHYQQTPLALFQTIPQMPSTAWLLSRYVSIESSGSVAPLPTPTERLSVTDAFGALETVQDKPLPSLEASSVAAAASSVAEQDEGSGHLGVMQQESPPSLVQEPSTQQVSNNEMEAAVAAPSMQQSQQDDISGFSEAAPQPPVPETTTPGASSLPKELPEATQADDDFGEFGAAPADAPSLPASMDISSAFDSLGPGPPDQPLPSLMGSTTMTSQLHDAPTGAQDDEMGGFSEAGAAPPATGGQSGTLEGQGGDDDFVGFSGPDGTIPATTEPQATETADEFGGFSEAMGAPAGTEATAVQEDDFGGFNNAAAVAAQTTDLVGALASAPAPTDISSAFDSLGPAVDQPMPSTMTAASTGADPSMMPPQQTGTDDDDFGGFADAAAASTVAPQAQETGQMSDSQPIPEAMDDEEDDFGGFEDAPVDPMADMPVVENTPLRSLSELSCSSSNPIPSATEQQPTAENSVSQEAAAADDDEFGGFSDATPDQAPPPPPAQQEDPFASAFEGLPEVQDQPLPSLGDLSSMATRTSTMSLPSGSEELQQQPQPAADEDPFASVSVPDKPLAPLGGEVTRQGSNDDVDFGGFAGTGETPAKTKSDGDQLTLAAEAPIKQDLTTEDPFEGMQGVAIQRPQSGDIPSATLEQEEDDPFAGMQNISNQPLRTLASFGTTMCTESASARPNSFGSFSSSKSEQQPKQPIDPLSLYGLAPVTDRAQPESMASPGGESNAFGSFEEAGMGGDVSKEEEDEFFDFTGDTPVPPAPSHDTNTAHEDSFGDFEGTSPPAAKETQGESFGDFEGTSPPTATETQGESFGDFEGTSPPPATETQGESFGDVEGTKSPAAAETQGESFGDFEGTPMAPPPSFPANNKEQSFGEFEGSANVASASELASSADANDPFASFAPSDQPPQPISRDEPSLLDFAVEPVTTTSPALESGGVFDVFGEVAATAAPAALERVGELRQPSEEGEDWGDFGDAQPTGDASPDQTETHMDDFAAFSEAPASDGVFEASTTAATSRSAEFAAFENAPIESPAGTAGNDNDDFAAFEEAEAPILTGDFGEFGAPPASTSQEPADRDFALFGSTPEPKEEDNVEADFAAFETHAAPQPETKKETDMEPDFAAFETHAVPQPPSQAQTEEVLAFEGAPETCSPAGDGDFVAFASAPSDDGFAAFETPLPQETKGDDDDFADFQARAAPPSATSQTGDKIAEQGFEVDFGNFESPQYTEDSSKSQPTTNTTPAPKQSVVNKALIVEASGWDKLKMMVPELAKELPPAFRTRLDNKKAIDFPALFISNIKSTTRGLKMKSNGDDETRLLRARRCCHVMALLSTSHQKLATESWKRVLTVVKDEMGMGLFLLQEAVSMSREDKKHVNEALSTLLLGLGEYLRVVRSIGASIGDLLTVRLNQKLTKETIGRKWCSQAFLYSLLEIEQSWNKITQAGLDMGLRVPNVEDIPSLRGKSLSRSPKCKDLCDLTLQPLSEEDANTTTARVDWREKRFMACSANLWTNKISMGATP